MGRSFEGTLVPMYEYGLLTFVRSNEFPGRPTRDVRLNVLWYASTNILSDLGTYVRI